MSRPIVIHQRVAEVEHLLGTESTERIAQRLSYRNADNLRRMMRRAGRHDLSDALGPDTTQSVTQRLRRVLPDA